MKEQCRKKKNKQRKDFPKKPLKTETAVLGSYHGNSGLGMNAIESKIDGRRNEQRPMRSYLNNIIPPVNRAEGGHLMK